MRNLRFPSLILAFALVLVSSFCFAECALARPEPCHQSSDSTSMPSAGEFCCPEFVALKAPQSLTALNFQAIFLGLVPILFSGIEIKPTLALENLDSSPPFISDQTFSRAHAIHAPPLHF